MLKRLIAWITGDTSLKVLLRHQARIRELEKELKYAEESRIKANERFEEIHRLSDKYRYWHE